MRRAKIIATLGPATDSAEQIRALVDAGMDIARLNLSHGAYAEHELRYAQVRAASDAAGRAVGILVDLQGPKIRLGRFAEPGTILLPGAEFTITTREVPGTAADVSTTYAGLPGDFSPGDRDPGRRRADRPRGAVASTATDVLTRVIDGGLIATTRA